MASGLCYRPSKRSHPDYRRKDNIETMDSLLSGAAFGAALTASGVYEPATILSQFDFTNFHMLQTFLTAAAGSTYVSRRGRPLRTVGASHASHHSRDRGSSHPLRPVFFPLTSIADYS